MGVSGCGTKQQECSTKQRPSAEPSSTMSFVDSSDVDGLFLFACAVLGLFMQVGFAMLEIGLVSSKNCKSVLIKNLINLCIVVFWWWLFGYTIATTSLEKLDLRWRVRTLLEWLVWTMAS